MANNKLFNFITNFNGERIADLGIQVNPAPDSSVHQPFTAPNVSSPVKVSADVESQPIIVKVCENAIPIITDRFKLTLDPGDESEYTKIKLKTQWIIIHSSCVFFRRSLLVNLLPEKLNILAIRVLLLPFELAWRVLKFVGELGWSVIKFSAESVRKVYIFVRDTPGWIYRYLKGVSGPGNVNITVGGPES
jgi:hypothetical protein